MTYNLSFLPEVDEDIMAGYVIKVVEGGCL